MKYEIRESFDLGRVRETDLLLSRADCFHFVKKRVEKCYPSLKGVKISDVSWPVHDSRGRSHTLALFSYNEGFIFADYSSSPSESPASQGYFEQSLDVNCQASSNTSLLRVVKTIEDAIRERFPSSFKRR